MPENNIRLVMKNKYQTFTNTERIIADYFMQNKEENDFSIKVIKDKLFVSEASLSRFAQKCGYHGYREFIYLYEENLRLRDGRFSNEISLVLDAYTQILSQIKDLVDVKQIDRIVEHIKSSKHILVIGMGSAGLAAKEMKIKFMKHSILLEAINQSDDMILQASLLDKDSLLIAITLSGVKSSVIESLVQASKLGAKTILITGNALETYSYCEEVVKVPLLAYGDCITTQIPVLMTLDMIYQTYCASLQQ